MKDIKSVQLVYFSGTGGTARIAGYFENAFLKRGIKADKTELNAGVPAAQFGADLLVVLFPVYACNAPEPVTGWLAGAEAGNGRPAAVIAVSGGGDISPNTASRMGVIRQLEKKGYRIQYESMFVMPSNFFVHYDDVLSAMILKAAPGKAERAAEEILSGRVRRTEPYFLDRVFSRFGTLERRMGKLFGTQLKPNDRCTGCAWCAGHCPGGNITMRDRRPVFGSRCVVCLRCVYGCPQKAITPGFGKFFVLKDGYDLKTVESRTEGMTEFPPVEQLAKGYLLKGVKKYLDDNK